MFSHGYARGACGCPGNTEDATKNMAVVPYCNSLAITHKTALASCLFITMSWIIGKFFSSNAAILSYYICGKSLTFFIFQKFSCLLYLGSRIPISNTDPDLLSSIYPF